MNLESLANELLLDLFEYLNIAYLFRSFYGLNIRFNKLLFLHIQLTGHINFQSLSKTDFNIICRHYLPKNIDQITSVHLSNDDETPQLINHFFSYGFHMHQFTYLKSLSLSSIYSEQIIMNIINELHQLDYLTHLKIDQCQVDHELLNNGWIFNQIWSLTKLTNCHFERKKYLWNPFFISPKTISLSLKNLFLQGFSYNSNELHSLFEHTINLENLSIDIEHNYDYQQLSSVISSIKKLNIFVQYSPYITNNLLRYMPNLVCLTIELAHIVIDGYQWKEIIVNYLCNLKKFHFKMEFYLRNNEQKEEQVNQLINSFRNQFWMDKHQWFIQCHWYLSKQSSKAYLYTLPYYFNDFSIHSNIQFKSTCPNNNIHWVYDNVKNLSFNNNSICQSIRFSNLCNLDLQIPFNDYFWTIIPNFDRLVSLNVKLVNNISDQAQLTDLLQRAIYLNSLTLKGENELIFNLRNSSIRRLYLYDLGCFNEELCARLTHSPLGIQCEILFVTVKDRINIPNLVNGMKNLRVLNVRCQDDSFKQEDDDLSSIEDELIEWLKDCLPNTCIITRGNTNGVSYIQLWIR